MGARTDGIVRGEIVTPPEFRGLASTSDPAGRVGGARIELLPGPDGTRLGTCYQQIPVRVMPPFQFDSEPAALLYLINLTAGLLDGDAHRIDIAARAGSNAVVTGQSATRIHPALTTFATQQWDVAVEEGACLVALPGPAIPYRGCRYYQRGRAELAPSARLLWGDIWLPGRYERGELSERFVFERIVQDLEVRRGGRLVYRDRFRWDGPWSDSDVKWYWGGERACGSLFVGGPLPVQLPPIPEGVRRSVFTLDTGESCLRWVGSPGAVTADLVRMAMTIAGFWTGGRPWLIESSELTPNHWFSL